MRPLLPFMEWVRKAVLEALNLAEMKFATGMKKAAEKVTTG